MDWQKAGRKPKAAASVPSTDKPWTKDELSLKPGMEFLAVAVIKRWRLDGSPECDRPVIEGWLNIIKDLKRSTREIYNIEVQGD